MVSYAAPSGTKIGHVHLQVSDIERSYGFYTDVLGLETMLRYPTAAFLSAGGYHHHIGLNQWYSHGATRPMPLSRGLARVTIAFESAPDLIEAVARLDAAGVSCQRTSTVAGTTISVTDPDGITIDLFFAGSVPNAKSDSAAPNKVIAPTAAIGSLDLVCADRDRQEAFYRDVLGFQPTSIPDGGTALGTQDRPHMIGLDAGSVDGHAERPTEPGLYHMAILYPTRSDLAAATARMVEAGAGFRMAEDHVVSNAVYFLDPENNGIELYWDRPRSEWRRDADGRISMDGGLLDLTALLAEA